MEDESKWNSLVDSMLSLKLVPTQQRRLDNATRIKLPDGDLSGTIEASLLADALGLPVGEVIRYQERLPIAVQQEKIIEESYDSKYKPEGWKTTDPKYHDPSNFRYIIHVITRQDNNLIDSLIGREPTYHISGTDNYSPHSFYHFLRKRRLSCSMIDERHRKWYGASHHGFILDAPEENIIGVSTSDAGNSWDDDEEKWSANFSTAMCLRNEIDAQEFMRKSHSNRGGYNEVIVDCLPNQGIQVKISAVFVFTDPVLGLPIDMIGITAPRHLRECVDEQKMLGFSIDNKLNHFNLDRNLIAFKYHYMRARNRLQEAYRLADLLEVPLVYLPGSLRRSTSRYNNGIKQALKQNVRLNEG